MTRMQCYIDCGIILMINWLSGIVLHDRKLLAFRVPNATEEIKWNNILRCDLNDPSRLFAEINTHVTDK